ncbi:MAG: hypothetical protein ACRCZP_11020 [Phycicoccus sp.]
MTAPVPTIDTTPPAPGRHQLDLVGHPERWHAARLVTTRPSRRALRRMGVSS